MYEIVTAMCPACGSWIDHCQGHGEIGDPFGYKVLQMHDDDDHTQCAKYLGECVGL